MGLAGISRNYSSPVTVSVEVLTLPVAAEPTLRATVYVQFRSRHTTDCLEERFCFASTWFLMDIRSVDTYRNVSLHTFSTDNAWQTEHISNRKQTC